MYQLFIRLADHNIFQASTSDSVVWNTEEDESIRGLVTVAVSVITSSVVRDCQSLCLVSFKKGTALTIKQTSLINSPPRLCPIKIIGLLDVFVSSRKARKESRKVLAKSPMEYFASVAASELS